MTYNQRQLISARRELNQILATGRLVYSTGQQLITLRDLIHSWVDDLGVELVFDPYTPPELRDYLVSAGLGAVDGACAGGVLGLAIGAIFSAPTAGLVLGLSVGGVLGAAAGASAVGRGIRVRVRARWTGYNSAIAVVEAM